MKFEGKKKAGFVCKMDLFRYLLALHIEEGLL